MAGAVRGTLRLHVPVQVPLTSQTLLQQGASGAQRCPSGTHGGGPVQTRVSSQLFEQQSVWRSHAEPLGTHGIVRMQTPLSQRSPLQQRRPPESQLSPGSAHALTHAPLSHWPEQHAASRVHGASGGLHAKLPHAFSRLQASLQHSMPFAQPSPSGVQGLPPQMPSAQLPQQWVVSSQGSPLVTQLAPPQKPFSQSLTQQSFALAHAAPSGAQTG